MIKQTAPRAGRRHGGTLMEAMMAIAIAGVVLGAVAQLVAVIAGQQRLYDRRHVAVQEAGNLMEDLMSRPWSELDEEQLTPLSLSDWCRQTLPNAQLRVKVSPANEADEIRRISVRIEWGDSAVAQRRPVELTAWRARIEEVSDDATSRNPPLLGVRPLEHLVDEVQQRPLVVRVGSIDQGFEAEKLRHEQ